VELFNELNQNPKVKKKKTSIGVGSLNGGISQNTINVKYSES
jgi:hypothetical protein